MNDELAVAAEQFGKRPFALAGVEHVVLLDFHPRQAAAFGGDKITHARQGLFVFQVGLARREPFVARNDAWLHVSILLFANTLHSLGCPMDHRTPKGSRTWP